MSTFPTISDDEDLAFSGDILNFDTRKEALNRLLYLINRRRAIRRKFRLDDCTAMQEEIPDIVSELENTHKIQVKPEQLLPFSLVKGQNLFDGDEIVGVVLPDHKIFLWDPLEFKGGYDLHPGTLFNSPEELAKEF